MQALLSAPNRALHTWYHHARTRIQWGNGVNIRERWDTTEVEVLVPASVR
jgi:hypothetical protein